MSAPKPVPFDENSFRWRLMCAIKRAGLTQKEVAHLMSKIGGRVVSVFTVGRWVKGESEPTVTNIDLLCQVLGVSAAELVRGKK